MSLYVHNKTGNVYQKTGFKAPSFRTALYYSMVLSGVLCDKMRVC